MTGTATFHVRVHKQVDSESNPFAALETPHNFNGAALNLLEENVDNITGNIHGALIGTESEALGKAGKKRRP